MRMRYFKIGFFILAALGLVVSCSTQNPNDSAAVGGEDSGGIVPCAIYWVGEGCDPCMHQECCSELAACGVANMNCISCAVYGHVDDPECIATKDLATAVRRCAVDRCKSACWPEYLPSSGSSGSSGSTSSGSGG